MTKQQGKLVQLRSRGSSAIRLLGLVGALCTTLALFAAPAMAQASSSAALVPVSRIVIFDGTTSSPDGPDGPLTGNWVGYEKPQVITTTDFGTLEEDITLGRIGACSKVCGQWYFNRAGVELLEFHWVHNGVTVLATDLESIANNIGQFQYLPQLGEGVYTPTCLGFEAPNGDGGLIRHTIQLDTSDWKWSEAKAGSTCSLL